MIKKPKYQTRTYVKVIPLNGETDDFGKRLFDYEIDNFKRGFNPLWEIYSVFTNGETFIYNFGNGYRFYEENLIDWYTYEPEKSGFTEDISRKIGDEIKNYQRKIVSLNQEIEQLKEGKESEEIQALRKLNDDLAVKLKFYEQGHVKIVGDQNNDDCGGRYLKWGQRASEGLQAYQGYCNLYNVPVHISGKLY